jgi:hypothetical protein
MARKIKLQGTENSNYNTSHSPEGEIAVTMHVLYNVPCNRRTYQKNLYILDTLHFYPLS